MYLLTIGLVYTMKPYIHNTRIDGRLEEVKLTIDAIKNDRVVEREEYSDLQR